MCWPITTNHGANYIDTLHTASQHRCLIKTSSMQSNFDLSSQTMMTSIFRDIMTYLVPQGQVVQSLILIESWIDMNSDSSFITNR